MLTFESCQAIIKNRPTKKLANNTYLAKKNEEYVVTLHHTDIIRINEKNEFVLNTGGWQSKTTKSRLNEYTKAGISQKGGIWYISGIPFYDGIKINSDGIPIDAKNLTEEIKNKKAKLDKMVKKYIDGYLDWALKNGIERSSGDCWYCLMNFGDSLDHIWSHVEESYYFGSFVDTAIRGGNYTPFWRIFIENELKNNKAESLSTVLRSYFRKIKPRLMEYVI